MTVVTITATRVGHVPPSATTAAMTTTNRSTAVRLGLRSRWRPTHHSASSPTAPHASRIGPTKIALTPLDSSNTVTKVYTVNCPRNANRFDADTATSAPRPAPAERPDVRS